MISIIIPCYNAERWVQETLDSYIAQTYRSLEVVDDGSTGDSLVIMQKYAKQHPELIRYETGPNQGGCIARNGGLTLSRGEYILFLDADNFMEKQAIAEHVKSQMEDGTKLNVNVSDWKRVRDLDSRWEVIPLIRCSNTTWKRRSPEYSNGWVLSGTRHSISVLFARQSRLVG